MGYWNDPTNHEVENENKEGEEDLRSRKQVLKVNNLFSPPLSLVPLRATLWMFELLQDRDRDRGTHVPPVPVPDTRVVTSGWLGHLRVSCAALVF